MTVWDWQYAGDILPDLLKGLLVTVEITALAAALALVLGLPLSLAVRSPWLAVKLPARLALEFVRGTPPVVQIFFGFYVLPKYGVTLSPFLTGAIVLGVHFSAYMAEAYRAAIDGIPKGQWEAALALNLSRARTWQAIVLPQALRASVPVLATYVISMYKETALLFAIGTPVLLFEAREAGNQSFRYLEAFTVAGLLYLIVSYASAVAARRLEVRHVRQA